MARRNDLCYYNYRESLKKEVYMEALIQLITSIVEPITTALATTRLFGGKKNKTSK